MNNNLVTFGYIRVECECLFPPDLSTIIEKYGNFYYGEKDISKLKKEYFSYKTEQDCKTLDLIHFVDIHIGHKLLSNITIFARGETPNYIFIGISSKKFKFKGPYPSLFHAQFKKICKISFDCELYFYDANDKLIIKYILPGQCIRCAKTSNFYKYLGGTIEKYINQSSTFQIAIWNLKIVIDPLIKW